MRTVEITEAFVDAARFVEGGPATQMHWDTKTTGFILRLYPSGRKSFVVGYRPAPNTGMSFKVIGKVGQIKVKAARAEAARILANKEDPIQELKDRRRDVERLLQAPSY
jgi:hypothetical protein